MAFSGLAHRACAGEAMPPGLRAFTPLLRRSGSAGRRRNLRPGVRRGAHLASGAAQGWSFYLTRSGNRFEVVVRLVAVALAGVVLGTLSLPPLRPSFGIPIPSRERLTRGSDEVAVAPGRVRGCLAGDHGSDRVAEIRDGL